jgi:hypothetical protein
MTRVPAQFNWLQWWPNKQLPNVLLEGASLSWTRLFFSFSPALRAFTSLRDVSFR